MEKIKLRWFQEDAINSIFNYFKKTKGKKNPLIVAPTGSGKSLIIAGFCKKVLEIDKSQKILILSHVKEILSQDKKAILSYYPEADIGIYSAGLNQKRIKSITLASIQSAYNAIEKFNPNIILIDECHLIPHKGQGRYRTFLQALGKPLVGLSATPFRLGTGYLHLGDGAFFDEIAYNITIKQLIEEGYLCKVIQKAPKERLDPEGIKKAGGDFIIRDLALRFDREEITRRIVGELLLYKESRKKWLLFAINIEHAEHIASLLRANKIDAQTVHSKMSNKERDRTIQRFKKYPGFQCLVSVAILTTGFDAPNVDLVGLLRPTSSPVLHIQIIGRGLRPYPGKENCLVLDFAGNLMRNGPIDAPVIRVNRGDGTGEAIMKECPECFEIVHAAVKICPECNHEFVFRHHLSSSSGNQNVLYQHEWHNVLSVSYDSYYARSGYWMLLVRYDCGIRSFKQYIALEHPGYARHRAIHWWKRRHPNGFVPENVGEALYHVDDLEVPKKILVDESGKYDNIIDMEF